MNLSSTIVYSNLSIVTQHTCTSIQSMWIMWELRLILCVQLEQISWAGGMMKNLII